MFDPISIGTITIKNRFVHSATQESMAADDGRITDAIIRRYTRLARGDIGLIIPGHLFVHPSGRAHEKQSGIHSDSMINGLQELVQAVHANGAKIAFQLNHGGRQCPGEIIEGNRCQGPESVVGCSARACKTEHKRFYAAGRHHSRPGGQIRNMAGRTGRRRG
jgi:2,4-dienoyl-CoA reductase-like NADH-dependent reductase (Old Yellow Enzyme family)